MLRSLPAFGCATALAAALAGCGSGTADRVSPLPLELASAQHVYSSADFAKDANGVPTLTVIFPSPSAGEQLAVFLMNVGGPDRGSATVSVSGTTPLPLAAQSPLLVQEAAQPVPDVRTMHEIIRQRNETVIADVAARGRLAALAERAFAPLGAMAAPATTTFCVDPLGKTASRRTAILKGESATAIFYVDQADLAMYTPYETPAVSAGSTIWDRLTDAWESKIYPSDTGIFGPPSDVDGNGKLVVFFSSALNVAGTGILLGYYWAGDVVLPIDNTQNCTATAARNGSNGADMFYLNALGSLIDDTKSSSHPWSADFIVNVLYPSTLAHEFQHLINFNQHCPLGPCQAPEATWLNEGLSMVAEDEAGYGWHSVTYPTFAGGSDTQRDVSAAVQYLTRTQNLPTVGGLRSPYLGFDDASLTIWDGDPIGNYEGVHSWFRYFTDRLGTGFLAQLATGDLAGIPNFERAAGMTFSQGLADFTSALLFSNEDFSAGAADLDFTGSATFDFTGTDWTPFHAKLRHLDYGGLDPSAPTTVSLRQNGWKVFLTGPVPAGSTEPLTVTLAAGTVTPWVTLVRFTGALPR